MSSVIDELNTVRMIRTGTGHEDGLALVLSACDAPTFGMVKPTGEWVSWRQDLTRMATPEETAQYWRDRAVFAERALEDERRRL